ncbi:DUF1450 domain-containing protein [Solibacillus sp. CAU 1738]|uniref:DUF1450 domain-containing protein n=1 Tax=Solibacillus sp. CAU 1738 TaxID=3140363 RepID=UPI003260B3B0
MVFSFFKKGAREKQVLVNQVDICISNIAQHGDDLYDAFENRDDVQLNEFGCTSNCEVCDCHAIAVVNGDIVKADDQQQLIELINESLV